VYLEPHLISLKSSH